MGPEEAEPTYDLMTLAELLQLWSMRIGRKPDTSSMTKTDVIDRLRALDAKETMARVRKEVEAEVEARAQELTAQMTARRTRKRSNGSLR